jgi:hypothetical protein
MLYQLEVQLGVAGEHRVLVGGSESHTEEQAHICIPIVGAERALLRATSDSCLPQGCHQGPSARRNLATCSASAK